MFNIKIFLFYNSQLLKAQLIYFRNDLERSNFAGMIKHVMFRLTRKIGNMLR